MTDAAPPEQALLIRKLETVAELAEAERSAILALPISVENLPAGHDVVADHGREARCCLILDGFLHRYKLLPDGARQILAFHLPGDVPDLFVLGLGTIDHSIGTLVPSRVAFIAHDALLTLARDHVGIAAAFWRDTLIDAGIYREWIVNVGQRSVRARLAHMFCEVHLRAEDMGLTADGRYPMPLGTADIADATGLTRVDVRRALQDLRAEGLVAADGTAIKVLDIARLRDTAGFDPSYLHVRARSGP